MKKQKLEKRIKTLENWIYYHGTIDKKPNQMIRIDEAINAILDHLGISLEQIHPQPEIKIIKNK